MILLRPYQSSMLDRWRASASAGRRPVLVLPTGGGKTVIMSAIAREWSGPVLILAHRHELVTQLCRTLASDGIAFGMIAPPTMIRDAVRASMDVCGASLFSNTSRVRVASVDTLRRVDDAPTIAWLATVTLAMVDECHHVVPGNKWAECLDLLPALRCLTGVTATPCRLDGRGLDGMFDDLIIGPTMRQLQTMGALAPFKVYAPPSTLDRLAIKMGSGGDFQAKALRAATEKSSVFGDVVTHYQRLAPGLRGITFADSIESSETLAARFESAGVPACAVDGKTLSTARTAAIRDFEAGRKLQLVNVGLFAEGFDVPAVSVVSDAAATASYVLFSQRVGRMMRPLPGKPYGLYIDHVGNVGTHGLPSARQEWSLAGRKKRANKAIDPVKMCPQCAGVYERVELACPYCGHAAAPMLRTTPALVDGDLTELDPDALHKLTADIARVDGPPVIPWGATPPVEGAVRRRHAERQDAQRALRGAIELWSGLVLAEGGDSRRAQREFFAEFGVDVATAQTLGRTDAESLTLRVNERLTSA